MDSRPGTNAGSAALAPADVTAVIVTRGNIPLDDILVRLNAAGFRETLIWINGVGLAIHRDGTTARSPVAAAPPFPDLGVYGRYAVLAYAQTDVVYVQDDDCIVSPLALERLLAAYEPGRIAALMPESRWADYPDSCLVGWGAVFDRHLPALAFERFGFDGRVSPFIEDDWTDYRHEAAGRVVEIPDAAMLRRTCDVVFTTLTPHVKVPSELGVDWNHLPYAEGPDRMFKQPGHKEERDRMLDLARKVRDAH